MFFLSGRLKSTVAVQAIRLLEPGGAALDLLNALHGAGFEMLHQPGRPLFARFLFLFQQAQGMVFQKTVAAGAVDTALTVDAAQTPGRPGGGHWDDRRHRLQPHGRSDDWRENRAGRPVDSTSRVGLLAPNTGSGWQLWQSLGLPASAWAARSVPFIRSWTTRTSCPASSGNPRPCPATRHCPPWQLRQPISVEVGATTRVEARTRPDFSSLASIVNKG